MFNQGGACGPIIVLQYAQSTEATKQVVSGRKPWAQPITSRCCTDCGLEKPVSPVAEFSGFHNKGLSVDGVQKYQSYCKECARERNRKTPVEVSRKYGKDSYNRHRESKIVRMKAWKSTPEARQKMSDYHLKRFYGLTREEWTGMFKAQKGLCAMCGVAFPRSDRAGDAHPHRACVDHDHRTGALRSLICDPCNKVLAFAEDDPAILRAGAGYLEFHKRKGA